MKGVGLLKEGIIWRIGNGESVRIWEDPWLPKGLTRKLATPIRINLLIKVSELINPITGVWDEQLICEIFWPEDANDILRIPIVKNLEDWPAWYFDAKGLFSVKSAYKVTIARRGTLAGWDASTSGTVRDDSDFEWYIIWKLNVPNKVKMFMWRFAHNSLPVQRNLARRGVVIDTRCPVCARLDEDCGHLFFKCKYAKLCWRMMNMEPIRVQLLNCGSAWKTCNIIGKLEKDTQLKVIIFLWR